MSLAVMRGSNSLSTLFVKVGNVSLTLLPNDGVAIGCTVIGAEMMFRAQDTGRL
jgi:hypothetical protein